MSSMRPGELRFSGYSLTRDNRARLFLPGHGGNQAAGPHDSRGQKSAEKPCSVELEVLKPGSATVEKLPVRYDGRQWVSPESVPLGTAYRFRVDGRPAYDWLELSRKKVNGPEEGIYTEEDFNIVSPHEAVTPQVSPVIADVLTDSILTHEELARLVGENNGVPPMRNHFNQYGGNEKGLAEITEKLRGMGFSALLFKPFIGGDNLSSHKYWTVDPFVLNNAFSDKRAFRRFLANMLENGMKLYADGAFVNQGLNGVQFMSLLAHGFNSPYWDWFNFQDTPKVGGPLQYPRHAFDKFTLGVLPTVPDPQHPGHRELAYDRFAFRLLNEPDKPGYNPDDYSFIELYDPNTQTADGRPLQPGHDILGSEDSVQNYRFPVRAEDIRKKQREREQRGLGRDNLETKKLFLEWGGFRLTPASLDDSAFKWDGQIDVAKMNTKNPEVLAYLDQAVGYWSRFVMNAHTATVAKAMAAAREDRNGSTTPAELLQAVTRSRNTPSLAWQIMPPPTLPEAQTLSLREMESAMREAPSIEPGGEGSSLASRMLAEAPPGILDLPVMFKAVLAYPGLQENLRRSPLLGRLVDRIFAPLTHLPALGRHFRRLQDLLRPKSFEQALAAKLDQVIGTMDPKSRDKLRYAKVQSLAMEALAQKLYIFALTGRDAETATPRELEKGLLETTPKAIRMSDPETAAELLPRFLKKRFNQLDSGAVSHMLEKELALLDPALVSLAQAVVRKRELGLNWRIDAAKDVADMDRVRNADLEDRPALFKEEVAFAERFWAKVGATVRQVFPKASIIAELTDFGLLSNNDAMVSQSLMNRLFDTNTFTGTPNMSYVYSQIHQLVNFAQRPDEFGAQQMTPGAFVERSLRPMSRNMPWTAVRQYQNLSSSHDYMTTSHALLVNPFIFTYDHEKYFGLADDLAQACGEAAGKTCFSEQRAALEGVDLNAALDKLKALAGSEAFTAQLPGDVWHFIDENTKKDSGNIMETPAEFRPKFVDALFDFAKPGQIGLNTSQHAVLRQLVRDRMTEPSEAKAMRAVITNVLLAYDWTRLGERIGLNPEQSARLGEAFKSGAWRAMDRTISRFGRQYGYQPLDLALGHLFEQLDDAWATHLPSDIKPHDLKETLKTELYAQASRPVLDKLLRIFAVQNAIPGSPSVYLPDLFAQGGAEWIKNMFVQNRNAIRVDKLADDPEFKAFFESVGRIFNTRRDLPVLHNGSVLPVPADDRQGVLPIVRDNGQDQLITLVNTGMPSGLKWKDRVGSDGDGYAAITQTQREIEDYASSLKSPYLTPGSVYRDIDTNRHYVLSADGRLLRAELREDGKGVEIRAPQEGPDFRTHCMLIRDNTLSPTLETPSETGQVNAGQ